MRNDLLTEEDVARVAAVRDGAVRNLQITYRYHLLSRALADMLGADANWCTFATWASRQAGQTIRQEDALRTFERLLGESNALAVALNEDLKAVLRFSRRRAVASQLLIERALSPAANFDRASDAVARGNLKVFAEIGAIFARFVAAFRAEPAPDEARLEAFVGTLRPGEPPGGQQHLRQAFTCYYQARFEQDARARAELVLLANLLVGFHEQTRLQPEIGEALDASVVDAADLRRRILAQLFGGNPLSAWFYHLYLRWTQPIDRLWADMTALLRRKARLTITELLMTLQLPGGPVLLGRDLVKAYPPALRRPANPDLAALLRRVDPVPGSGAGSGAVDWSDLGQRLHFITELFRAYQQEPSLFDPPFTPDQVAALEAGRLPGGRL